MSKYIKKSGSIELHYGYNEKVGEYWYEIHDLTRKNFGQPSCIQKAGSKSTNMPPLVLAEKLKEFGADKEHIRRVLYMRKI